MNNIAKNSNNLNNAVQGQNNQTHNKNNGDKSKRSNGINNVIDKNTKTQTFVDSMQAMIDQVQTSTVNSKQGTQVISKKLLQAANAEHDRNLQKSQLNLTQDLQNMKFKIKKVQPVSIVGQIKKKDSQNTRNNEIQKSVSKQNNLIAGIQQTCTGDIYRNEYLVSMGGNQNFKKSSTINRISNQLNQQKKSLNKSDIQGAQKNNSIVNKSPLLQEQTNQSNDYYSLEQTAKIQLQEQQSPQDYDFNAAGFLAQENNFDSNEYNNQFYKTQIYNQQPPNTYNNLNKTHASNNSNTSKTNVSVGMSNIKLSKSQLKQNNQKNNSQNQASKTQIRGSQTKIKDISPLNNRLKGEHTILEKYLANNDFTSYGMNYTQKLRQKKRSGLNASALIINNQGNTDYLNSTAPLNMNQINNLYSDEQIGITGHTDVVNSTQNLRRINSKESWQGEMNQQLNMSSSLYYGGNRNGIMNLVNDTQQFKSSNNNTQSSVTPLKDQRKKQILIKNILLQDGFNLQKNKKYFLNLTLQQLIQQQKQQALNLNFPQNQYDINKSSKSQKRLNKTLDNIKEDTKTKMMDQIQSNDNENQDLRQFIHNFVQGGQLPQNYVDSSNTNSRQQVKSFSSSVNKFSNTMKISDFNNTQQIFPGVNKKSKSSLKSTQNINLQDVVTQSVIHNQQGNQPTNQPQKYSALSTYSQNLTGNGNSSTYGNLSKSRKVVSTKTGGVHINSQSSKNIVQQQKHKKKSSQDQELIKLINFYQDETISKFKSNDLKNKTHGPGMKPQFNAYQAQTKFKTNSTLNHYLNNTKSKQIIAGEQRLNQNQNMSNTFVQQMNEIPQVTNLNQTDYVNYDQLLEQNTKDAKKSSQKRFITNTQQRQLQKELAQSTILLEYNQYQQVNKLQNYSDLTQIINPYAQKKTSTSHNNKKGYQREIQNKTQPIPRHILEMAQAEAINFSTGTSIIINKQQSKESNKSKSTKTQKQYRQASNSRLKQTQEDYQRQTQYNQDNNPRQINKIEDPGQIYNNKNTVILDEVNSRDQDSLEDGYDDSSDLNQKLDRFVLGKQIGQGAYAVVRIATLKKTGKKYAIKVYDKSKLTDTNRQRSVRREIKLLQKMNHQNIVKIYEAFETDNHVYLVMEYVGGDNLYSYLKQHKHSRLEEKEAKRIFKQLLTALQYCHRKSIAHRDIKLENILLDEEKNVKLLDFGFSTCIPNDKKIKMFCGTPSYMAPEIVNKEEYAGPPADIWASGVLLYALMNGKFPFRGDTDKDLYRRINRGAFEIHNLAVSQHLINFLTRMINTNADLRPSAEELLLDEWFKVEVEQSILENEKLKKDYINDQKKLFKAKILSKIPIEKTKNTICLLSSNDKQNGQKTASHNINLGAVNQTQINPLSNFRQNLNLNDQSDYGINNNPMRKLNQEAYQAYYNTSGGAYGQTNSNMQNPYYNNFFSQNNNNGGFYANQNNQNTGFYPGFQGQNRLSPSKTQGMNINTNPQIFPINFTQQPPNQIGTPQVFGSPTGFHCSGGMINNNFNIVNNITQVTCLPQPPNITNNVTSGVNSQDPKINNNLENIVQSPTDNQQQTFNLDQQISNPTADLPISQQSDLDEGIIDSIAQMGYHRSHVVSQLECETSHIANLYNKLKEDKMSMTQNRPLSLQPHGRRIQYGLGLNNNYHQNYNDLNTNHNNAVFAPQQNFIPSITDSLKGTGDNETSGEYTQMCNPNSKVLSNNNIRLQNMNNYRNIKPLNNNYTDYDYDNSSGTGEYQFMHSGSNTLQNTNQNRDHYSPKIVSLNSSDM